MQRTKRQLLSVVLTAAMVLQTAMPSTVFATEGATTVRTIITGFEALEQTEYSLPIGADQETIDRVLDFPKTVTAEVMTVVGDDQQPEVATNSTTTPKDEEILDEDAAFETATNSNAKEVELAVTWESDRELITEDAGEFVYTAVLADTDQGRYDLDEGVKLPEIIVMVGAPVAMMMAQGINVPTVEIEGEWAKYVYANGTPIVIEAGVALDTTKIRYNDGTSDVYLDLDPLTDGMQDEMDLSAYDIYGGTKSTGITINSTSVKMIGGKVGQIFGGSWNGIVTGDTSVTITAGKTSYIYGGGLYQPISGNTTVQIGGTAVISSEVYGGGQFSAVVGSTRVEVSGEASIGSVYGGGNGHESHHADVERTTVIVKSYKQIGTVWGGSNKFGTVTGTRTKNCYVARDLGDKLQSGTFDNLMYKSGNNWKISGNAMIPTGVTHTLASNETLSIPKGNSLTNEGTVAGNGTIAYYEDGAFTNTGTMESGVKTILVKIDPPIIDGTTIYANGNAITIEAVGDTGKTTLWYMVGEEKMYILPDAKNGADLSGWTIFGGAKDKDILSTNITMISGTVGSLYGGGSSNSVGSTNITIIDGDIKNTLCGSGANGGTVAQSTGYVTRNLGNKLQRATFNNLIYKKDDSNWEANGAAVIPDGKILTIADGETLTVNGTLTALDNSQLVTNAGSVLYIGLRADYIEDIGDQVYNGDVLTINPIITQEMTYLGKNFRINTGTYTTKYQKKNAQGGWAEVTEIKDAGTYRLLYTKTSDNAVTVEKQFHVLQSATELLGGIKVYNEKQETNEFTYGDTITVKVTPKATGELASKSRSASLTQNPNQMALFVGENQITLAQTVVSGQELTFEYNTTGTGEIAPNTSVTITARYLGGSNMASVEGSVNVTVKAEAKLTKGISDTYYGGLKEALAVLASGEAAIITLLSDAQIAEGEQLTIPREASFVISEGLTLTVSGLLENEGSITGKGKIVGTGKFYIPITADNMSEIQDMAYNGNEIEPVVTFIPKNILGKDFTVHTEGYKKTYQRKGIGDAWATVALPKEAGTYKVVYEKGSIKAEKNFNILQSTTELPGGIKAYNGAQVTNEFTYGDTITFIVTPKATGEAASKGRSASLTQAPNQMALFVGEDQITSAQTVVSGTKLTFTYETKDTGAITPNTPVAITAKYLGDSNMASVEGSVNVTVKAGAELIRTGTTAYYEDVETAMAAAVASGQAATIKLLEDRSFEEEEYLTIPKDMILMIPKGRTLTVNNLLTNYGTITIEDGGAITGTGILLDKGTVTGSCSLKLAPYESEANKVIAANGIPIKIVAGTGKDDKVQEKTNILYDIDGNGTIENTEYLQIGETAPTAVGYDLSQYTLYGGANTLDVENTHIVMNGGTLDTIFGGGKKGHVKGDTDVLLTGTALLLGNAYGGGDEGEVKGTAKIEISGEAKVIKGNAIDREKGNLYGGGKEETATVGNTKVTVAARVDNVTYGGGQRGSVIGEAYTLIQKGQKGDAITGGAEFEETSIGSVKMVYQGGAPKFSSGIVAGVVNGDVDIIIDDLEDGGEGGITGIGAGYVKGDLNMTVNGGNLITESTLQSILGFKGGTLYGSVYITVNGGELRNVYGMYALDNIKGSVNIKVNGGKINGSVNSVYYNEEVPEDQFTGVIQQDTNIIIGDKATLATDSVVQGDKWRKVVKGSESAYVPQDCKVEADTFDHILYKKDANNWEGIGNAVIPDGETVTVNSGQTLTLHGSLTAEGTGSLQGSGTLITTTFEPTDIKGVEDQVYTGNIIPLNPTIDTTAKQILGKSFTVKADGYTISYEKQNDTSWEAADEIKEVGNYRVVYTKTMGERILKVEKPFRVLKAGTEFKDGIMLDHQDKRYTYGDAIQATVTPKMTGVADKTKARSVALPTEKQMALFLGEKQISAAVNGVNGVYTMTCDTAGKELAIGSNVITAKYVGDKNTGDHSETVTIQLQQKPLTAVVSGTVEKVYDGSDTFHGVTLTVSETVGRDVVTATATGRAADANAGDAKAFTADTVKLSGADAAYYSITNAGVSGTVKITAATPSYKVANQNIKIGKGISAIAAKATATGVNNTSVAGTLRWSQTEGGTWLDSSYQFTGVLNDSVDLYWNFVPEGSNYKAMNGRTTFTLTNKDVPVLLVEDISKTYDGTAVSTVNGSASVDGTPVAGTFQFAVGTPEMMQVGTYTATVEFIPQDTTNYSVASTSITISIRKAVPTGKPSYTKITSSNKTLADAALTVGSITPGGSITWDAPDTTAVLRDTAYTWTFTPSDHKNYETLTGTITLWVKSGGSTGGSGGGGGGGGAVAGGTTKDTITAAYTGGTTPTTGAWSQNQDGSWNILINGQPAKNQWACIANPYAGFGQPTGGWFFFDENGKMRTGWFTDTTGKQYYLNPVSDGKQGMMLAGWVLVDGTYYYFNQDPKTGTFGALVTNTTTPDGYVVNEKGEWVQ